MLFNDEQEVGYTETFKARDVVGRLWHVPRSAVINDYVEAVMQMDDLDVQDAQAHVKEQGEEAIETWWWEQVFPHPELVMSYGEMVEDISEEHKERLIRRIAMKGYMEEEEIEKVKVSGRMTNVR